MRRTGHDIGGDVEELTAFMRERLAKLDELSREGIDPFPGSFSVTHPVGELLAAYGPADEAALAAAPQVTAAGRIMSLRGHGKASFAHIQDRTGRIQIYVRLDGVGEEAYRLFKRLDVGDFIGVTGRPFRTKTGELTSRWRRLTLLAKSLRPLPEKWHGLSDVEVRYRQRYVDLIANPARSQTSSGAAARIVARHPPLPGRARVPGSRDADDAVDRRRRDGRALSSRTTTRWTWTSTCASRRSCT